MTVAHESVRVGSYALDPDDLVAVTEQVWRAFLGAGDDELVLVPEPAGPLPVSSSVVISGEWEAVVLLEFSTEFARRAAGRLFASTPDDLHEDEVADAVGELANIVGGNVKSMVPGADIMSIPAVAVDGPNPLRVPAAVLATGVCFTWLGEPLVVSVLRTA